MKILYSLPKDEQFFGAYASLIPSLKKLGYLAQVITGLTELAILYYLIYGHLQDYLPNMATPGAILGAIVGTAFLEIGLRKFFPYGIRAILYKRFQGLHLVLSIAIWVIALVLTIFSGVIHFKGSKDLVKRHMSQAKQERTTPADSVAAVKTAVKQRESKADSLAVVNRYTPMIEAVKAKHAALIAKENLSLKALEAKERREGKSYSSMKAQIKGRLADLEAAQAQELAMLEDRKAQQLDKSDALKKAALASIAQEQQKTIQRIEQGNTKATNEAESRVKNYGGGLAWFSLICIGVFVFSMVIDEVHRKGSGVEEVPQPNQYVFSDTIAGEFWAMLSDKINYFARTWIKRQAERTPEPPAPSEPPTLWELAGVRSKRKQVSVSAQGMAVPQNEDARFVDLFNGQGYSKGKHNGVHLDNNADFAAPDTTPLEIPARSIVKGFLPATEQTPNGSVNNEAIVIAPKLNVKKCLQCGQAYEPKVAWQKFCAQPCKEAHHAEKHGGKTFDPKQYRKVVKT
jgi:hypothetical protein